MKIINRQSDFIKNVLTLISGTTAAQAILVLISPLLTRLYSPEDFAVLALFTSFTVILGTASSARYELAIVLPSRNEDAVHILFLAILISGFVGVLSLLLFFFLHDEIIQLVNNTQFSFYLYLVPLVVVLIGSFNAFNYYYTRYKLFSVLSKAKIIRQISSSIFQLTWGFFLQGPFGLVGGRGILHLTGIIYFWIQAGQIRVHLISFKWKKLIQMARRYVNFPKYSLPAQLANTLSAQLNILFISYLFGDTALGLYALVDRILNLPLNIISTSFGQVFLQKANEEKATTGTAVKIYKKTLMRLFILGLFIFVPVFFIVKFVFGPVFGNKWVEAGIYAQILTPLLFIRFISSPLSMINIVFEKQKVGMFWQTSLLLSVLLVFTVAHWLKWEMFEFLKAYTAVLCGMYGLLIVITYKFSKGE